LAQELVMTSIQHIQNLNAEELEFLSYDRSSYFTILFFVLKISRITPCENNKHCSIHHNEPNKIRFAFF
jgi:hypothetical protein